MEVVIQDAEELEEASLVVSDPGSHGTFKLPVVNIVSNLSIHSGLVSGEFEAVSDGHKVGQEDSAGGVEEVVRGSSGGVSRGVGNSSTPFKIESGGVASLIGIEAFGDLERRGEVKLEENTILEGLEGFIPDEGVRGVVIDSSQDGTISSTSLEELSLFEEVVNWSVSNQPVRGVCLFIETVLKVEVRNIASVSTSSLE